MHSGSTPRYIQVPRPGTRDGSKRCGVIPELVGRLVRTESARPFWPPYGVSKLAGEKTGTTLVAVLKLIPISIRDRRSPNTAA